MLFAVRRAEVDYIRPARFNEALTVRTTISEHGKASLTFLQEILLDDGDQLLCRGMIRVACLDAERFRPRAIPKTMIREMQLEQ